MSGNYIHEKGEYALSDVLEEIRGNPETSKAGAILVFIGVVRGETLDGRRVKKLSIEAYEEGANRTIAKIIEDLESREGIVDVQIHHLTGEFAVGEDLVYVAVAGGHREQVFTVLREAVNRYKSEVPVFKKEFIIDSDGVEKSYWTSEKEIT